MMRRPAYVFDGARASTLNFCQLFVEAPLVMCTLSWTPISCWFLSSHSIAMYAAVPFKGFVALLRRYVLAVYRPNGTAGKSAQMQALLSRERQF